MADDPTDRGGEPNPPSAVEEAAREIVKAGHRVTNWDWYIPRANRVARALLSRLSDRDAIIEECAAICDEVFRVSLASDGKARTAFLLAQRIRSLKSSQDSPALPSGEAGTLRKAAEHLLSLGSKIERASSEEEENRLCDERDAILKQFRHADTLLSMVEKRGD
jgi:hypothetical protein